MTLVIESKRQRKLMKNIDKSEKQSNNVKIHKSVLQIFNYFTIQILSYKYNEHKLFKKDHTKIYYCLI